jgi:hypothetical protein
MRSRAVYRESPQPYTHADRQAQLRTFIEACRCAASTFAEHGSQDLGRGYASLAEAGSGLIAHGFTDSELNALARSIPERLPWMHPKYLDYNALRQAWQEAAVRYVDQAETAALELRARPTTRWRSPRSAMMGR